MEVRWNWRSLMVWLLVCLSAEAAGAWLTSSGIRSGWYGSLAKPPWNPPDAVFGPVWGALFVAMAVAAWRAWEEGVGRRLLPTALFASQLGANVAWSGLFFTMRRPDLAFYDILVLWALVAATLVAFLRVSRLAGALMVPYLGWLSFAAILNFSIWRLNG